MKPSLFYQTLVTSLLLGFALMVDVFILLILNQVFGFDVVKFSKISWDHDFLCQAYHVWLVKIYFILTLLMTFKLLGIRSILKKISLYCKMPFNVLSIIYVLFFIYITLLFLPLDPYESSAKGVYYYGYSCFQ